MGLAAIWICLALWMPVECDRLVLSNGTVIPLSSGFQLQGRNLCFQLASGKRYSVGIRQVNWKKTFARTKAIKPKSVAGDSVQHAIPWDHPQFRDKMTKLKDIVITSEDVARFAGAAPVQRELGEEAEDQIPRP